METISREELKAMIDAGHTFKLVMALNALAFRTSHIPGSINITTPDEARAQLRPDDVIVVYCSDEACDASQQAYHMLRAIGYTQVRRYAGGLADWDAAGYPLEGEFAG